MLKSRLFETSKLKHVASVALLLNVRALACEKFILVEKKNHIKMLRLSINQSINLFSL